MAGFFEVSDRDRAIFGGGKENVPFNMAMPEMNPYMQVYDPNSMSATKSLEELYPKYNTGFNAFREEALRKGPSAWLNMSLLQRALQSGDKKEKGQLEMAGQTAKARDELASRGGMSSGARERVEEQGQKNYMSMAQDLSRQDSLADIGMRTTDEQNRVGKLGQLPGMEMAQLKEWETAKQRDQDNAMKEKERLNNYNMDVYKQRMETYAAERQANATENSGKK